MLFHFPQKKREEISRETVAVFFHLVPISVPRHQVSRDVLAEEGDLGSNPSVTAEG